MERWMLWAILLMFSAVFPVSMLIYGARLVRCPSKERCAESRFRIGYRSAMSGKNEDTWNFAQGVAGRFWLKWGKITLAVSAVPMFAVMGQASDVVGGVCAILTWLQMIPFFAMFPVTERALRRVFHQDGRRKSGN